MLFAYNEDGTLQVVADIDEARQHFEALDVESGAIRLFDQNGRPLSAVFPHRSERKFLGIRVGEDRGQYDLVTSDQASGDSLSVVLEDANFLMPNPWFADLDAVRSHVVGIT